MTDVLERPKYGVRIHRRGAAHTQMWKDAQGRYRWWADIETAEKMARVVREAADIAAAEIERVDCIFPMGCDGIVSKILVGTNRDGQRVVLRLCADHVADVASGRFERRTLDLMDRIGIRTDVDHPEVRAANAALVAHQESCAACGAVRTWTLREMAAGRVQTPEDRDRVGLYTTEHACAEGLELYKRAGLAMLRRA